MRTSILRALIEEYDQKRNYHSAGIDCQNATNPPAPTGPGKRGNTAVAIQAKFETSKYLQDEPSRTSGEPGKEIADEAIQFLSSRYQTKPFFLYLAFSGPHDQRVAAKQYMDKFERARIPLPKNFLPLHPFDNGEQTVRDELLAGFPRTEDEVRGHLHDYYAVMNALDGHIGRLLDHLKATGSTRIRSSFSPPIMDWQWVATD